MLYTAEDIFWITNNFVAFAHKLDACRDHEHRLNRTFRSETAGVDVGRANRGRVRGALERTGSLVRSLPATKKS